MHRTMNNNFVLLWNIPLKYPLNPSTTLHFLTSTFPASCHSCPLSPSYNKPARNILYFSFNCTKIKYNTTGMCHASTGHRALTYSILFVCHTLSLRTIPFPVDTQLRTYTSFTWWICSGFSVDVIFSRKRSTILKAWAPLQCSSLAFRLSQTLFG